jgi:hypothetical protein
MDIVSISALMNLLWYIFTIIFLLYKFTNSFSKIYTVYRIATRVKDGFVWIKNKILRTENTASYQRINTDDIEYNIQQSEEIKEVKVEEPPAIFSEFISNKSYSGNFTEKKKEDFSRSNALIELDLFLPFYKKDYSGIKDEEEIPLVESNYLDANS